MTKDTLCRVVIAGLFGCATLSVRGTGHADSRSNHFGTGRAEGMDAQNSDHFKFKYFYNKPIRVIRVKLKTSGTSIDPARSW
jgi:hypothetical protein